LLAIVEGSYNPDQQRYERTRYSVPAQVAELIGQAVTAARALPEYDKDRLAALERAAGDAYDEIPDAPPMMRRRKPKKSSRSPVMQSLNNAAKNLDQGKKALSEMPARMRAALLAGQGDEIREMLLSMRGQIDEIISDILEDVDNAEVDDMPEIFSGIPPGASETSESESHFRVEDINTTRKRPDDPDPAPEAVSAWGQLSERLTKPQVQSVEVELVAEPPMAEPDADEIAERAAILEFEGGLDRPDAEAAAMIEVQRE
jgi:hypothetical protein